MIQGRSCFFAAAAMTARPAACFQRKRSKYTRYRLVARKQAFLGDTWISAATTLKLFSEPSRRRTFVRSFLTIDGEDVFSILPPLIANGPFTINASLYDKHCRQTLKIVRNEFQAEVSNWDVEISRQRVAIRSAPGKFDLVIRVEPPHCIVIERLDMAFKNFSIQCREGKDTVIQGAGTLLKTTGVKLDGFDIAICVTGSSLSMGVGGGSIQIEEMLIDQMNSPPQFRSRSKPNPGVRETRRQGRNEPCRCGSGKKFKHCHGRLN
jgi:hypothetical protein